METFVEKKQLRIKGMTCVNCQNKIERELYRTEGIISAKVSFNKGIAEISYNKKKLSKEEIISVIESLGYEVLQITEEQKTDILRMVCILVVIAALYTILQSMDLLNMLVPSQLADTRMGYGMLFVIGLLTSVHCVAMCGGINLSQCIPQTMPEETDNRRLTVFCSALFYNIGRVLSYTVIGFVLGMLGFLIGKGTEIGISFYLQGILKIIAGLVMVIMGINMLGIFPWLRKFMIRVPSPLARKIGEKKLKERRPFIVGILNGFMPCGPLQSMWVVALATGNPFAGAMSMFLFSLGTVPLMLGLGSIVSVLGKKFTDKVMTVGAVLVVVLGLAMLSQGASLSGWNFWGTQIENVSVSDTESETEEGVQVVNSTLSLGKYPNITVQSGVPVKWVIEAPKGSINGCNYKMVIPDYNIEYTLKEGENVIEFTPTGSGTVRYTCWMGMIQGNIFVTNNSKKTTGTEDEIGERSVGNGVDKNENEADGTGDGAVPEPSGYEILTDKIGIAELTEDESGEQYQEISVTLTEEGFSPAIVVVQDDRTAIWSIENEMADSEEDITLLVPYYSTRLDLDQGTNQLGFYPTDSFDVSTGDNRFYCYVKVVEDLSVIDEETIKDEVADFEPLVYLEEVYEESGSSCCN